MPFVDYLKKLFGINDSRIQSNFPSNNQNLDAVDRQTLDITPYHQNPPRIDGIFEHDQFFEHSFQQLENFMRSLPMFGFPFGFGPSGPFQPPDPHDPFGSHDPFGYHDPFGNHPSHGSGIFPSHGFPSIFGPGVFHRGIFGPSIDDETHQESVSPRDEVLKPSYRSSARDIKDEDYDDLVREKGPEVILDMLKKSEETEQNNERSITVPAPRPEISPRSFGKFTSTRFSFVNGQSVQEQITRLPDGTFEKRVTTTNPNGETNTVITQHAAEEVMPSFPQGGLSGGIFGPGFGRPSFW